MAKLVLLRHRIRNRILDVRARLAGSCNADTWDPITVSYRAGYAHWRCGKARGHATRHRFNNYTWSGEPGERVLFDPLPYLRNRDELPFGRYANGRKMVSSRQRSRKIGEHAEFKRAERQKAREGSK